jgi:hypothetical protein
MSTTIKKSIAEQVEEREAIRSHNSKQDKIRFVYK